jgi:hypothetical protein
VGDIPVDPTVKLQTDFFEWLFAEKDGFICLAYADAINPRQSFRQKFFHWPTEKDQVLGFIERHKLSRNLWYGVNILARPERLKHQCISHDVVWSDLDTADPNNIEPKPNIIVESSPGHYQAIWKLDQEIPPDIAEDYSKRLAYRYRNDGADPTGWDLTQLLRIPYTRNLKYKDEPEIHIIDNVNRVPTTIEALELLEPAPLSDLDDNVIDAGMPDVQNLPDVEHITYKYQPYLERSFFELHQIEPEPQHDWSERLWKLENLAFEAGMEPDEVFSVAMTAKCNKYFRDGRPPRFLWREVLKAFEIQKRINVVTNSVDVLTMPKLVDEDECEHDTFIDAYAEWATSVTDAVPIFHDLCGAIILSATFAGHIKLETSYGRMIPNLWGLVLGASTIDRKTTAMEMAKGVLWEIDNQAVLATDGSAEGLLQGLSIRPGRVSVFHKDEVSGLFKSINKKDWMSGMPETFAQLYDVPRNYTRMLRKETVEIHDPVFIFFGGGIKDEVFSSLSDDYVLSGFLPRFLVVIGEQDITKIRPTTHNTTAGLVARQKVIDSLSEARDGFGSNIPTGAIKVGGQTINLADIGDTVRCDAVLTDEAWEAYQAIEATMVAAAYESYYKLLALPTFERLSRSLLKLSLLIAASRQEPQEGTFDVELRDVRNAARFVQRWGRDSIDLMLNAGKTSTLRQLEKIRRHIASKPGIYKTDLMRLTHLSSREMNEILMTLVDRGEVRRKKQGKGEQWWTIN